MAFRSLWQTPLASSRTCTSPARGGARSSSCTSRSPPTPSSTAARMVVMVGECIGCHTHPMHSADSAAGELLIEGAVVVPSAAGEPIADAAVLVTDGRRHRAGRCRRARGRAPGRRVAPVGPGMPGDAGPGERPSARRGRVHLPDGLRGRAVRAVDGADARAAVGGRLPDHALQVDADADQRGDDAPALALPRQAGLRRRSRRRLPGGARGSGQRPP